LPLLDDLDGLDFLNSLATLFIFLPPSVVCWTGVAMIGASEGICMFGRGEGTGAATIDEGSSDSIEAIPSSKLGDGLTATTIVVGSMLGCDASVGSSLGAAVASAVSLLGSVGSAEVVCVVGSPVRAKLGRSVGVGVGGSGGH
jgi:hypothetical protein